jgi:hypothetical protein
VQRPTAGGRHFGSAVGGAARGQWGAEATTTKQPSLAFEGTLARAYRRACRIGIAQVGTDLVLCYAARHVRCVWDRLPSPWQRAWRPVRKGKTGLTDPQPPPRTVWEYTFDEEVAFEADAVLRDSRPAASWTRGMAATPRRSASRSVHGGGRRGRPPVLDRPRRPSGVQGALRRLRRWPAATLDPGRPSRIGHLSGDGGGAASRAAEARTRVTAVGWRSMSGEQMAGAAVPASHARIS